ncbi:MAG TPA: enoyl-CoA hydratase/isomerase family protein [Ochrobactrum intermedium]|uniref:Enoyl-CoA hydratase/isomerase family protein n=1 Tax=Brucella intermedia TaxID=94625 RepID=A0A7V6U115_9HYPH|nr:enoyl-CoA hydratase/isomerase family protein [Brucella intermedia]HHV69458.1 enoyl-CoA hydratase/isomerase family protein [Brucella intermedia]
MASQYETIQTANEQGIGRIILNRPKTLNAINGLMIREVTAALKELEANRSVRAVVLSGEGRAFSAGFDLKESSEKNYTTASDWRPVLEADFEFIMQFWECKKPTISAVHGYCLAGGLELALACDITIASEDTVLGEPEVRFGSGIVALIVPWIVSPKHAKDILLTGNDKIPASRAADIGLITEMVPTGQHLERALEKAREIATGAPLAVELTKRAINRSFDLRGMRASLLAALDTDIIIEASGGPERSEFNRIRKEEGLKEAIAWRDARYAK